MLGLSKKATLFRVAAFFVFFSVAADAQKKKSGETYQDIISKAHNLVLQKDRQQAQLILLTAAKAEKIGTKAQKELKKTLTDISKTFLSDKAQQLYELSLSLKRTDLNQAQQKLAEAVRIEPENTTILLESSRQSLTRNECVGSEDFVLKVQKIDPYDEELMLVQAQTQLCGGNLKTLTRPKETPTNSIYAKEWLILEIEKYFKEKNFVKAKELAAQLKKVDKNHPELGFWVWKIDSELKSVNLEAAQKYIMDCRNLNSHSARRYGLDPWLCQRTSETEAFIKSQSSN